MVKDDLKNKPLSFFENENARGKSGAYAGSEWTPYNLLVMKQWIAMRDNYTFTDSEEEIYKGDWEQLDIKEYHSKYGTNYIYIDNERKLWRIRKTADEFYNHRPHKRPKLSKEDIEKALQHLYAERQELQDKLLHCNGNIEDFEDRLRKTTE